VQKLSEELGIPVVPTVATKGKGMEELKEVVCRAVKRSSRGRYPRYGEEVEKAIKKLVEKIERNKEISGRYPARWLAIKILERDPEVVKITGEVAP